MILLFKSVFTMFLALLIFVSNGVAQDRVLDHLNQVFLMRVQAGDLEAATELVVGGIDARVTDNSGRNAFILVATNYNYKNHYGYRIDDILLFLISWGADVRGQDRNGRTALSYYYESIIASPLLLISYESEILLRAGAELSDADREYLESLRNDANTDDLDFLLNSSSAEVLKRLEVERLNMETFLNDLPFIDSNPQR